MPAPRDAHDPARPVERLEGALDPRAGGAPTLRWEAVVPEATRACVLLVHGYGEYAGRYRKVVDGWAAMGIATAMADLRGHGWSGGARGHCQHFHDFHDDVTDMLAVVRERLPKKTLVGFGHSFGGLVATTYAIAHPGAFSALVLSSPYFGLAMDVPGVKLAAGKVLSRLVPGFSMPSGLHGGLVTHDVELARRYDADPLMNKNVTARWFTETSSAQRDLAARAPQLKMPVLCVQAGDDKVVSATAARSVFDRFGSTDKRFDLRAGLYHEVLKEPQASEEIAEQMGKWILAHA